MDRDDADIPLYNLIDRALAAPLEEVPRLMAEGEPGSTHWETGRAVLDARGATAAAKAAEASERLVAATRNLVLATVLLVIATVVLALL